MTDISKPTSWGRIRPCLDPLEVPSCLKLSEAWFEIHWHLTPDTWWPVKTSDDATFSSSNWRGHRLGVRTSGALHSWVTWISLITFRALCTDHRPQRRARSWVWVVQDGERHGKTKWRSPEPTCLCSDVINVYQCYPLFSCVKKGVK